MVGAPRISSAAALADRISGERPKRTPGAVPRENTAAVDESSTMVAITGEPRTSPISAELYGWAKELRAPYDLVTEIAETGKLPVPLFSAGGVATPADAALCMQLGAEAVFVGSGIFESGDPSTVAKAIVEAVTHFQDPTILAKVSRGLGVLMPGLEIGKLDVKYADRGW